MLAADSWNDYDYLKSEFRRLASIHRHITVAYPDDCKPWQLHVRDWCLSNQEQFTDRPYRKNVFEYGPDPDPERDHDMFWDELPDEVWKIESSRNHRRRPSKPVWPEQWNWAIALGIPCTTHRYPGSALRNSTYRRKPKSYYNGAV